MTSCFDRDSSEGPKPDIRYPISEIRSAGNRGGRRRRAGSRAFRERQAFLTVPVGVLRSSPEPDRYRFARARLPQQRDNRGDGPVRPVSQARMQSPLTCSESGESRARWTGTTPRRCSTISRLPIVESAALDRSVRPEGKTSSRRTPVRPPALTVPRPPTYESCTRTLVTTIPSRGEDGRVDVHSRTSRRDHGRLFRSDFGFRISVIRPIAVRQPSTPARSPNAH